MRLPKNAIIRDGEIYVLRKSRKRGYDHDKGWDKVCVECAFFQECNTALVPCALFGIYDLDNTNFKKLTKEK